MTRQAEFNSISNNVADRYTSFLETILAAYNRAILSGDVTARGLEHFKKEVANIHKHYLEREVEEIVSLFNKMISFVETDTRKVAVPVTEDEEWQSFLSDNTNFLFEALKLQSSKDILYINNFLRSKILQMSNMGDYEAAYNLVFNHKELNFYYTDKIGRKINSVKYVRTVTRDYAVKNYNDLIVGAAILNAIESLTVVNVDSNHKDHGKVVAVKGENELNYFSIREEIFHPNSNSIVRLPDDIHS